MALINVSESVSQNEKQQLPKKEDANSGGQNQKRDVDNVESTNLKNNYKGASSGKKASRASYDSDTEYGNKKQVCSKVEVYSGGMTQKREEEAGSKHNKERYISDSRGKKIARNSVDSQSEYANKRKLKDENLPKRKETHTRGGGGLQSHYGRDMYRATMLVRDVEQSRMAI